MRAFILRVGSDRPIFLESGRPVASLWGVGWETGQRGSVRLQELNRHRGWDEAVWKNASMRAGARGGARVGKPRCVRILMMTAGSSMAARMVKGPPHWGQVVRSMAKTRLSNWAQLLRARVEAAGDSPSSLEEAVARSASPGTIWERRAALGASTPWKRRRWSRGRGMSAARRWRNSKGGASRDGWCHRDTGF